MKCKSLQLVRRLKEKQRIENKGGTSELEKFRTERRRRLEFVGVKELS